MFICIPQIRNFFFFQYLGSYLTIQNVFVRIAVTAFLDTFPQLRNCYLLCDNPSQMTKHQRNNKNTSWCFFLCVSSCVHLREHRAEKLFKPQQGEIRWFGLASPFNHRKGYANRNLFWRAPFRSPFYGSEENENIFSVSWKFKACAIVRTKAGLCCSRLWSAAHLPVKGALEDFWLTAANAINPGTYISCSQNQHQRSLLTCQQSVSHPGSSVWLNIYVWIFDFGWNIFVTQTEMQRGRLLNSSFSLRRPPQSLSLSVCFHPEPQSEEEFLFYRGRKSLQHGGALK